MKKSKKLVALFVVVIMAIAMLPLTSFASFKVADPDPIVATYVDSDGTEKEAAAVPLTADMTELTSGWYIVNENILMEDEKTHTAKGITITGDVKLIIADTGFLSIMEPVDAPAIKVVWGNQLTIYGQGQKNGNGMINVHGGENSAGIGGGAYERSGMIVINSGSVHAVGGVNGAGIGGGLSAGATNIRINGGTVNCISGENGAAIGGGHYGYGSTIKINGGLVTCVANENGGTGLGGGILGKTENIAINGGTTVMYCENSANALGDTASSDGIENVFIADNCYIWTTPETSGQDSSCGLSHSSTEDLSATLADKTKIVVYGNIGNTVTINVNKNGKLWATSAALPQLWQDGVKVKDTTVSATKGIFTVSAVPNGTYDVYAKVDYDTYNSWNATYVDTGINVVVNNNSVSATVDYYSVTLAAGDTGITAASLKQGIAGEKLYTKNARTYLNGQKVSFSAENAVKTGYSFTKWASNGGSTMTTVACNETKGIDAAATYTAYSTANTYTVKYYLDGVEQTALTQNCIYGKSYSYATLPTMSGTEYSTTVSGWWSSSASATDTQYTAGGSFTNLSSINGAVIRRYAYSTKTAETYTNSLIYNANGGTGAPSADEQNVTYPNTQSTHTISKTEPTRIGYSFAGWYTAASGGTKIGTSVTVGSNNVVKNQNRTIYAHWKANTVTINVNKNGKLWATSAALPQLWQDGVKVKDTAVSATKGVFIVSEVPNGTYDVYAKVDYDTYNSWNATYVDTGINVVVNNNSVSATVDYYSVTLAAGDTGITAANLKQGIVGGKLYSKSVRVYLKGQKVSFSAKNATKTGYTFNNWASSGGLILKTATYNRPTGITAAVTYTAYTKS